MDHRLKCKTQNYKIWRGEENMGNLSDLWTVCKFCKSMIHRRKQINELDFIKIKNIYSKTLKENEKRSHELG